MINCSDICLCIGIALSVILGYIINILNIISAGKLKIKSGEWIRLGVPTGMIIMIVYYGIFFII
ncbi:DUF1646 domain-containing protein [Clostridium diolis]|nr:DUF1646 domain-containing protein [Clostridium beijerinckii NRRL B-598]PSM59167.1 DUF1646 domain-containing protein [Clostridium diolis]